MKFREFFRIGGITQIIGGFGEYLTISTAQIYKVTLNEDSVTLYLRRESDRSEATSSIRVLEKFQNSKDVLLRYAFDKKEILNLTPEQVLDLDVNLRVEDF